MEGSAEHSLLTTTKKQLQQQWDLIVAQVKGMAAAAKADKPVQISPIVIPNNARPWQAPMPDPLLGHDEDIAKVLAGVWDVKRFVEDGEEPSLDGSTTVTFSKNRMISHFKVGEKAYEIQSMYRIAEDKFDIWSMDSGPDVRNTLPHLGSYSIENDTLRICYHDSPMELETPQARPPVQPGKRLTYWELQRKVPENLHTNNSPSSPSSIQLPELDMNHAPLVSDLADRVSLGSIKTIAVEYEVTHSRGKPVELSQIDGSFKKDSFERYSHSNYPAKLCLDLKSGNGYFSGEDSYKIQKARNEVTATTLVHLDNRLQATLHSPRDVTIRGQYAGYDKWVTNPFPCNRSLEDVLRGLIRGHEFLDERSPQVWFRVLEDSDSLFRFDVVDHYVDAQTGDQIPEEDRQRVSRRWAISVYRYRVTLNKRLKWAMTELVRYQTKSNEEGLEHGPMEIGERILFSDHKLVEGIWLPKNIRRFVGYSDETVLMELSATRLSANAPEAMIDTLEIPEGSRVSDERTISEGAGQ